MKLTKNRVLKVGLVQNLKFKFVSVFLIIVIFSSAAVSLSWAQERDSAPGELKLEGKYIERLVLLRKDGHREEFNRPEETIRLPMGEYRLREVYLRGGYTCHAWRDSKINWVTVAPEKPAVLKVGAPLKQTVKVERRGRILVLDYELLGAGTEKYTSGDRSKPPTFTVYKGDKEIASDKFEFG